MQYSHWKLNPRLVHAWLNRSGETIRWLEEKGVRFEMYSMFSDEPPSSWYYGLRVGSDIVKVLTRECRDTGVRFTFETRVTGLLRDTSGTVRGVAAVSGDRETEFAAKAVIIATGG